MATVNVSADDRGYELSIYVDRQFDPMQDGGIIRTALIDAAKQVADKWIEENRDLIYARLNVDAIANMIMLDVANAISSDVSKK